MSGPADDAVLYSEAGGYGLLTLNRPERKNAFNAAQYDGFRRALESARGSSVRCVVVAGSGGAFSAGADITEWADPPRFDDGEPHGFEPFIRAVSTFDKPLIAAVDGVAVGIGVTLLLHCDFVLASEASRFRTPFVSLGILPEAGSSFLGPRLLGRQGAAELLLRGAWLSAERAAKLGLVSEVVEGDVLAAATEIAAELAELPVRQLQLAKGLLLEAEADLVDAALTREAAANAACSGSDENREAIAAFMEKRRPDFSKFD